MMDETHEVVPVYPTEGRRTSFRFPLSPPESSHGVARPKTHSAVTDPTGGSSVGGVRGGA
jgi:hypothetical protein